MGKIATKKKVDNNAGILRFISGIKKEDVKEVADFGRFQIIILKDGAIFHTTTGFEIRCKAWTADFDGNATEASLFSWLCNVVAMKKEAEAKKDEEYPYTGVTYGDLLDGEVIITEANLLHPVSAFIDMNKAAEFAQGHIKWLGDKMSELENAINTPVKEETEEDLKKNFESGQEAVTREQVGEILNQEESEA